MANNFRRYASRNVGTAPTAVGAYTVGASTQTTLIGLSVANVANTPCSVTAVLYDGVDSTHLIKNAPLPIGSTLIVAGGGQKVVLMPGDQIRISSTVSASVDAVISLLEIT
jgi:hypothetical protein